MFTGIISDIGFIESAEQRGDLRLTISCAYSLDTLVLGESIACNGACLTVVDKGKLASGKAFFAVDLSGETVARTASGQWAQARLVNMERALKLGDALDGHMVTGHIDGIATVIDVTPTGDSLALIIETPAPLARFIAEKGSVTLDGVSLTVNKVEGRRFWINIIPHTARMTTLGTRQPGDQLNIEIDMIARYVERLMANRT